MAITKTLIANSSTRSVIKVASTAAADSIRLVIRAAATPVSIAAVTFVAATKTITRGAGSWISDFTSGSDVPSVGDKVAITFTGGSALNLKTVVAVITSATVLTVLNPCTIVNEGPVAISDVQWAGIWSDLGYVNEVAGAMFPTKANITRMKYSVSSAGTLDIERNSVVVARLFGHDDLDGFGLAENNTYPLVVTFNSGAGGTLIVELAKLD